MYLYLGQNVVVAKKSVVGVFDLDNASSSHITREYLKRAEKSGRVVDVSGELPKAVVVTEQDGAQTVYLCQLNSSTLLKRWEAAGFQMGEFGNDFG